MTLKRFRGINSRLDTVQLGSHHPWESLPKFSCSRFIAHPVQCSSSPQVHWDVVVNLLSFRNWLKVNVVGRMRNSTSQLEWNVVGKLVMCSGCFSRRTIKGLPSVETTGISSKRPSATDVTETENEQQRRLLLISKRPGCVIVYSSVLHVVWLQEGADRNLSLLPPCDSGR